MKYSRMAIFGLTMATISGAPILAVAAPEWSCVEPALTSDLQHRIAYNDAWAQLVVSEKQGLDAFADLIAAQGNAAFEMDQARIAWLWRTDPDRFAAADDFLSFAWTEADAAAWLDTSADNAAMQARMDSLSEQVANHPDLDEYMGFINIDRQDSPFHDLAETLAAALDADHAALAACF